jgi:hypothetical protein
MDRIGEIKARLVDRFYLLTIGIGRTENRLFLFTKGLGLLREGVPLFMHGSNSAWKIYELMLFSF